MPIINDHIQVQGTGGTGLDGPGAGAADQVAQVTKARRIFEASSLSRSEWL